MTRSKKNIAVLITAICALIAFAAYAVRRNDGLSQFSVSTLVLLGLAAAIGLLDWFKPLSLVEYVPYILTTCAFGIFLKVEMDFFANVYTGLDGNTLDALLLVILAAMVIGIITGIVSVIRGGKKVPEIQVQAQ